VNSYCTKDSTPIHFPFPTYHTIQVVSPHNPDAPSIMSKKQSHPEKFVGLFCYKCPRTDFGGSAQQLASHRQFCNSPKNSLYQDNSRLRKKKKMVQADANFTITHSNSMSQFPFLMNNRSLVGNEKANAFPIRMIILK
jgi:hypothetical protein